MQSFPADMMTQPLAELNPRSLDTARTAVFLDFDGTLVEIADHPDQVRLTARTRTTLAALASALDGAVAIVTGRDIEDVDRFLAPLTLPVAGVHGLRRRSADGRISAIDIDAGLLEALGERIERRAASLEGLMVERKSASVALHYRARPDLEAECLAIVTDAIAPADAFHLVRGKMVFEAKFDAGDKGKAIAAFLAEAPFKGRTPFFAGDDVTDEDAFAMVESRDGLSVKIGPGPTGARYRATSIADFLDWLRRAAGEPTGVACVEQS